MSAVLSLVKHQVYLQQVYSKAIHRSYELKRGTLWDFSTSIPVTHSVAKQEKIEKKNVFGKKSHNAEKN